MKEGQIERVNDEHTAIGRNLFQKEVDLNLFFGMRIELETGEQGTIEGSFGKSGKFKLRFPRGGLKEETHRNKKIIFRYKRFLFDATKHLVQ
jgi:selenocysteine-specific elongation factor